MIYTNGHHKNGHVLDLPGTIPDKLQPHDVEAEEAVIGSLLIDPDAILKVSDLIKPADFFIHRLGWIYGAMKALFDRNIPTDDSLLIADELKRMGHSLDEIGGELLLNRFRGEQFSSLNAEYYAGIIAEKSTRRRVMAAAGEMARLANNPEIEADELIAKSEKMLLDIGGDKEQGVKSLAELSGQAADYIERVYQMRGKGVIGIPTGLSDWDRLTGGLQAPELLVIGGRPGMGKSGLALQIAKYTAKKFGKRWLYFSLEMSELQLMQRLFASESGIDASRLRLGDIRDNEWAKYTQAVEDIARLPISILDIASLTPSDMRSIAIRHAAKNGLDGVIVDYIQLMDTDSPKGRGNRTQDVSDISRGCKKLARELSIPVIALSSLNRSLESRPDKRPMMSDLRESGSIESDADSVVFIYRDEVYRPNTEFPNIAEIIVSKHRSAPCGVFSAYFKKHLIEFVDLEVRRQSLEYTV